MIKTSTMVLTIFAAFLFVTSASAQIDEGVTGTFYASCGPTDGAATTIELSNHLRITIYEGSVKSDDAYRTKEQVFEGEKATMEVSLCPIEKETCQPVKAVLTTYKTDAEEIEAAIEYFDGTETQGDAESIQGHTASFKVHRDKGKMPPVCG